MQLYILRNNALQKLITDIGANIKNYSNGNIWVDKYFATEYDSRYYRETGISIPDIELKIGGSETDADNAELLYQELKDVLYPRLASDLRLWAYLTHKDFYPYMVTRWKITNPDITDETDNNASGLKKQFDRIRTRYFFGASNGKAFVRQGIARLYWSAALTYDPDNSDPYEMTRYFLNKQDCFVAATERTLARNKTFLLEALRVLKEVGNINRLDTRAYFAELNRACGIELLDSLSSDNAYDLCRHCLDYVISLPAIKTGSMIKIKNINSGQIMPVSVRKEGLYLGKSLLNTKPKNLKGYRLGSTFTYGNNKTRAKIVEINN